MGFPSLRGVGASLGNCELFQQNRPRLIFHEKNKNSNSAHYRHFGAEMSKKLFGKDGLPGFSAGIRAP
jgi:hypothetical protein